MEFFKFFYEQVANGLTPVIVFPIATLLGVVARWDLGLSAACLVVGRRLVSFESATGFQDALTPPWRTKLFLVIWSMVVVVFVATFFQLGTLIGFSVIALYIVTLIIAGAFLIPKPESSHYLRLIHHSLVNRKADFRRDGDHDREQAISVLIDRFNEEYDVARLVE